MFRIINKDTTFGVKQDGKDAFEGGKIEQKLPYIVIERLCQHCFQSVREIAEDTGIDIHQVKKICRWLEKKGYVRRHP